MKLFPDSIFATSWDFLRLNHLWSWYCGSLYLISWSSNITHLRMCSSLAFKSARGNHLYRGLIERRGYRGQIYNFSNESLHMLTQLIAYLSLFITYIILYIYIYLIYILITLFNRMKKFSLKTCFCSSNSPLQRYETSSDQSIKSSTYLCS